jgi:hypothetical protein
LIICQFIIINYSTRVFISIKIWMSLNWNHSHLTAIVLSSLILGAYAWLVPDIIILILYPTNKSRVFTG